MVQKFPNISCFVRDISPKFGFVFNEFPNLGTEFPNEIPSHGHVLDSVPE